MRVLFSILFQIHLEHTFLRELFIRKYFLIKLLLSLTKLGGRGVYKYFVVIVKKFMLICLSLQGKINLKRFSN